MSYEDIYALKPAYQTEPGYWKLQWRPLWRKTFSVYVSRSWASYGLGINWGTWGSTHNGWNRSYDRFDFSVRFFQWTINFWIKWNYIVHESGPSDVRAEDRRPLNLEGIK